MTSRIHYIYIPGLGDKYDWLRRVGTWHWQLRRGVTRTVVPMRWKFNEPLSAKYDRVLAAIDLTPANAAIVVVGESAGGSVALTVPTLTTRNIAVVTFCGKNTDTQTIGNFYRKNYQTFVESVTKSESLIASGTVPKRLLVCYSTLDPVVPVASSSVPGDDSIAVAVPGHLTAIGWFMLARFRSVHEWALRHSA